ncbi:putative ribonuclease H-like domain-containing protein [Tanacetum coccineum]
MVAICKPIAIDDKTDVLTYHKKLLGEAEKEKEELKAKVEKWHNTSESLNILLNSQMSARDKAGLGYGEQMNKGVLSTQDNIDAGKSEMEAESAQDYFVLPMWSSYTSMVKSSKAKNEDELERLKSQEKEANDAAKAQRKKFAHNTEDLLLQAGAARASSTNTVNTASTPVSTVSPTSELSFTHLTNTDQDDLEIPDLEDSYDNPNDGIFTSASYDDEGVVANFTNLETLVNVSPIPTSRINSIHPSTQILGDPKSAVQTRSKVNKSFGAHAFEELLQFKIQKVWNLIDLPFRKKAIGTKWVYKNKKDEERGLWIEAIRIFLAFASYMGFIVYQMDVKSAFLYGTIDEEVYVSQPLGFIDPKFRKKSGYRRGTIDKNIFIKKDKNDIMLVKVYVDDINFGSTKRSWCDEFEALMKSIFQMNSMGELTFFLGLQVKHKEDGIFISQDKYVAEILKKFDFASVKTASTLIETQKPLTKDEEAADVDVHLYRSMIGSLMYLTASRPDIMFAVCACSRFQVTPKTSHLNAVKRIFRYLKGKPKLGLWYPRVSSFDLEAYSDSDYAGANLDRKSTTGGCQFLGRRLISWQCKKQTIVATSTTEAEYVAAANCCGQVLWIQNQMLDYGFNFMNTKIYIDNESTICIVKNPVFHSKTKHIEIRHHFIRDAYEKKLIQVLKIHTDDNVADLLTKAFDVSSLYEVFYEQKDLDHSDVFHRVVWVLESLWKEISMVLFSLYYCCCNGFWMSAKSKIINNVRYITAKVAGKPVNILEASIRSDLLFDDADGIDSLNNQAIFDVIQLMGMRVKLQNDNLNLNLHPLLFTQVQTNMRHSLESNSQTLLTYTYSDSILEGFGGILEVTYKPKKFKHLKSDHRSLRRKYQTCYDTSQSLDEECLHEAKIGRKEIIEEKLDAKGVFFDDLDDIVDDAMDYMESEDAQEKGASSEGIAKNESTDKPAESTDKPSKAPTVTSTPTPTTPTPTVFGDDETIAQVLIIISQNKEKLKEKEKGVELKDVEEIERPRPTSTRSLLTLRPLPKIDPKAKGKGRIEEEDESDTESEDITEAEKKFKLLANDEEVARKVQEEWEAEEEKKRLAKEEVTKAALSNKYDFIQARLNAGKILTEKLQEEEREKCILLSREPNFFMTPFLPKEDFLLKQRSEATVNKTSAVMLLSNELRKITVKEKLKKKEGTEKEIGTRRKMKSKKRKFTSKDDEELRLCLTIAPNEDKEVDYEILDKKYPIIEWRSEYLTTKPQYDETEEFKLFNINQNWKIVSWKLHSSSGVHTIMTDEGLVIHMLVENKYPLKKEVLSKLLELKLETEEDSTMALELIRFVKKQIAELEPKDSDGDEEDP